MSFGGGSGGRELRRIKEIHKRYLEAYKKVNNGSLEGATKFADFYIYATFTSRYSDPRACAPMGYR
jgi:hypothetical protein